MTAPAQDPDELFDTFTADGTPLGPKPRRLVHRDGDWHRSVHVWIALVTPRGHDLLFQRRSLEKDTWPGAIDVAVTGHLSAGEDELSALREAREEVGIDLTPRDVLRLGRRRRVDATAPGVLDREIQDIFFAAVDLPLSALRPDPAEVSALITLPLDRAARLFRGELAEAVGIRLADFVRDGDGYYVRACQSIEAIALGERPAVWNIP